MRAISLLVNGAVLAALLMTPPPVFSTVMTVGCANSASCTLDELALGATITVNDKVFSQWAVEDFSTLPVSLAGIEIFGIDGGGDPGIRYQAGTALSTSGFDLIDLDIFFTTSTTDPAMRIVGGSVEIEAFEFPAGNLGGFITLFTDLSSTGGALLDTSILTADNFPPPFFFLSDTWAFAPQSSIRVENNVLISGDDFSDTATLGAFSQRFTQVAVAEPPPLALALGALVMVCLRGGSRAQRRAAKGGMRAWIT